MKPGWRYVIVATALLLSVTLGTALGADKPPVEAPVEPAAETNSDETTELLKQDLNGEMKELKRLEAELEAIESAPLPTKKSAVTQKPASATKKPEFQAEDIPDTPAIGAEEDLADILYSLGEYKKARRIYRELADSKPAQDRLAWALFQAGNCARKTGDFLGAKKIYGELINTAPEHPWAAEATWWDTQIQWWVMWRESRRQATQANARP